MINRKQGLSRTGREFAASRSGNIVITSALAMPVLIGMIALSVEYGGGLMKRVENQRVADLAAFAAATAYGAKSTETAMQNAALNIARLNGLEPSEMTIALVDSPRTSGSKAVKIDVSTRQNLYLARVLGSFEQLQVRAASTAEVGSAATQKGCVYALSATETGVTMVGGTTLNAPKCTVASNNSITVPCGTKIVTTGAMYNGATPSQGCNGIVDENGAKAKVTKQSTTDPLSGHAGIANAVARLTTVSAITSPSEPVVPVGKDINFGWDENATKSQAIAAGCTAVKSNSDWILTCPTNKNSYNFGLITLGGGLKVQFNLNGPATTTYNFSSVLSIGGGTSMSFGSGNFNFAKGIVVSGGSGMTFGAGNFRFGRNSTKCENDDYSICSGWGSNLSFDGPSTFEFASGIFNGGGTTLTMGNGTLNSYRIGKTAAGGKSALLGGSGKVRFADATGVNSVFQVAGTMDATGGSSCIVFPAAAQHDFNGDLNIAGGIMMGAGVYTVDGYIAFGASHGGGGDCFGTNVSLKATDVSLVLSGKNAAAGSCAGASFCAAAGYSGMSLVAPKTGSLAKVAIVGPQVSTNKRGFTLAQGASGQISGVVYFPYGPILTDGGASASGTSSSSDDCLQIIGSSVTLKGGTSATSECIAAGGSSAAKKVSLVQ